VGTPKGRLGKLEKSLVGLPWREVWPGVEVKLALGEHVKVVVLGQQSSQTASPATAQNRRRAPLVRLSRLGIFACQEFGLQRRQHVREAVFKKRGADVCDRLSLRGAPGSTRQAHASRSRLSRLGLCPSRAQTVALREASTARASRRLALRAWSRQRHRTRPAPRALQFRACRRLRKSNSKGPALREHKSRRHLFRIADFACADVRSPSRSVKSSIAKGPRRARTLSLAEAR
jgi:hypothetical protein